MKVIQVENKKQDIKPTKWHELDWNQLRGQFIVDLFKGFFYIFTIGFLVTIYHSIMISFQPELVLFSLIYILFVIIYMLQSKVPEKVKVTLIILIQTLVYATALYSFGILATGTLIWAGFSVFVLTLLYQPRIAFGYMILVAVFFVLVAYGYINGNLELNVSAIEESKQVSKWINDFVAYFTMLCFLFYLVNKIQTALRFQVNTIKKQKEEIEYLANHDQLTDLPTLRLSRDRADIALKCASRDQNHSAILFLDLDGFKSINDTYGHDAGDMVLIAVAHRLKSVMRESDTASRIGGDEFLILLNTVEDRQSLHDVCNRLIATVGEPIIYKESELIVGVSIGCALFPEHGGDFDALRKKADEVMYEVKKTGKNAYIIPA